MTELLIRELQARVHKFQAEMHTIERKGLWRRGHIARAAGHGIAEVAHHFAQGFYSIPRPVLDGRERRRAPSTQ